MKRIRYSTREHRPYGLKGYNGILGLYVFKIGGYFFASARQAKHYRKMKGY